MEDVKTADIENLAREYRPSMDKYTVHDWAADAAAMLKRLAAAPAPLPGGLEDVARVIVDRTGAGTLGLTDAASMAAALPIAAEILALLGSRPSSPAVPTEQAEGAVVGDWAPIESVPLKGGKIEVRHNDGRIMTVWANPEWGPESRRHYTHWRWLQLAPTPASVSPGTEGGE